MAWRRSVPRQHPQGDPPKGYANWRQYWNDVPNRREVHELIEERLLPLYHRQHVQPLQDYVDAPFSMICWERFKAWWAREFIWPLRTPWWWNRLRTWVPAVFSNLVEWIRERLGSDEEELAGPAAGGGAS